MAPLPCLEQRNTSVRMHGNTCGGSCCLSPGTGYVFMSRQTLVRTIPEGPPSTVGWSLASIAEPACVYACVGARLPSMCGMGAVGAARMPRASPGAEADGAVLCAVQVRG
jgi:hypothetical protein